jgi:transcriptional regulator with XRE-family HTH domain
MARGNIPVVQLRRLRGELRRARELAGRTQKQVSEDLGWSLSKVIRQESGAQNISTADVMALAHYYRIADHALVSSLLAITRAKEQVWWWDEYRDVYPKRFVEFLAYEHSATSIRHFQSLTVPGLLQTERYARTLLNIGQESEAAELAVRVRLRRQEILDRENGLEAQFILDEAVIHRVVGGTEVMLEQLRRLRELNTRPHITIQVVPFTAGVNAAINGPFAIFDFSPVRSNNAENNAENMDVDFVVNIEPATNMESLIYDDPESASSYIETFYEIRDMAMSAEQTDLLLESKVASMLADVA